MSGSRLIRTEQSDMKSAQGPNLIATLSACSPTMLQIINSHHMHLPQSSVGRSVGGYSAIVVKTQLAAQP